MFLVALSPRVDRATLAARPATCPAQSSQVHGRRKHVVTVVYRGKFLINQVSAPSRMPRTHAAAPRPATNRTHGSWPCRSLRSIRDARATRDLRKGRRARVAPLHSHGGTRSGDAVRPVRPLIVVIVCVAFIDAAIRQRAGQPSRLTTAIDFATSRRRVVVEHGARAPVTRARYLGNQDDASASHS